MRDVPYLAYAVIWGLFLLVLPARQVVIWQFRRLRDALRGRFWAGLLVGALLVATNLLVLVAAGAARPVWAHLSVALVAATLARAAATALTEEMMVRGLLLTRLSQVAPRHVAVVVTSALFALMHVGRADLTGWTLTQYFVDGLLFGWATLATGDIWLATGVHLAKNWLVLLALGGSGFIAVDARTLAQVDRVADLAAYVVAVLALVAAVRLTRRFDAAPGRSNLR